VRAVMWGNGGAVGTVVAMTLVLVVLTGTVAGAMMPIILRRMGFDPALASSPFVASFVDVAGILIYMTIAVRVLALP
jgi:magnesium transporter